MTSFNYSYWRARRKPTAVNSESELPDGNWMKVPLAAKLKGYSRQAIYVKFYRGEINSFKVNGGPMLVNLDEIK